MDESSEQSSQENGQQNRARLVFAAILIAGLAVAGILIPLLASGDDDDSVVPADPECIESWNADKLQLQFGIHQFVAHNYSEIQVLRLADDGGPVDEGETGNCAVLFAALRLDPEPGAAAQIEIDGKWGPVSALRGVTPKRLGQLQSEAVTGSNATLDEQGLLTALATE